MRRRGRSICLLALLAIAQRASAQSPSTLPAEPVEKAPVETAEQFLIEQREALAQVRAQSGETPVKPIDALVRLDIANGTLVVAPPETHGVDVMNFPIDGDASSVFRLVVEHLATQPPLDAVSAHVMRLDVGALRALNVDLSRIPDHMTLDVTLQTLSGTTNAQLICQNSDGVEAAEIPVTRLYISRSDTPDGVDDAHVTFAEANFGALVQLHHDEAVAMLGEGLTAIHSAHVLSGVGQAEARAIFAASKPVEPSTQRELDAIVVALRERGSAALPELRDRLRALGSPAAAALQHRPRDGWSIDLALNVDTLTADLLPGGEYAAAALLASPTRMVDLLYSPDVAVRRGALEKLKALTTDDIAIDPDNDPYAHVPQIEALRSRLAKVH